MSANLIIFLWQLYVMLRIINYIKLFLIWSVFGTIAIYGILYFIFGLPALQSFVKDTAKEELSKLLDTKINITDIKIEPFNKLSLRGVTVYDQKDDTLLYVDNLAARFDLSAAINKKISISTVILSGFNANINKADKNSPANYQFIADAFQSNDTIKKELPFEIQLRTLLLRRGSINYDIIGEPLKDSVFDKNHIQISNIQSTISLKTLTADSLNIQIKKFGFEEKSGFKLNKVSLHIAANKSKASLRDFQIALPNSKVAIDDMQLDYSDLSQSLDFLSSVGFDMYMSHSYISPVDISAFESRLRNFHQTMDISLRAKGTFKQISIPYINMSYGNDITLRADATLTGVKSANDAYIFGKIDQLDVTPYIIEKIAQNYILPDKDISSIINNAGNISFDGQISGFIKNLVAYGNVRTDVGTIRADILLGNDIDKRQLSYQGALIATDFNLGKLLSSEKNLGSVSLDLTVDGILNKSIAPRGSIKGRIYNFEIKNYRYNELTLDAAFYGKSINGKLELNDPNANLNISGKAKLDNNNNLFDLSVNINNINLSTINITPHLNNLTFTTSVSVNFEGKDFSSAHGIIEIDSLLLANDEERFFLDKVTATSDADNSPKTLRVNSEFINAQVHGEYNFKKLLTEIKRSISGSLPFLTDNSTYRKSAKSENSFNDFDFTVNISDTKVLSSVLKLPATLLKPASLNGFYRGNIHKFQVEGSLPAINYGKFRLRDGSIYISKPGEKLQARIQTQKLNKHNEPLSLIINASASDGIVDTRLDWSNLALQTYSGNISTSTRFTRRDGKYPISTEIDIMPSILIFNDSIWKVEQSSAKIDSGRISVRDFEVHHNLQHIRVDGTFSAMSKDSLLLNLNDVNLDYIFEILNIDNVQFGGHGTGEFLLTYDNKMPVIKTDSLKVKDFTYKGVDIGDLKVKSHWNNPDKAVMLDAVVTQNEIPDTKIDGGIFIGNDSIHLDFDANRIDVSFIKEWTDDILKDLKGKASGNISLYGKFSALNVVGKPFIDDASFGVEYTNTYYSFSDSIEFTTEGLSIKNIVILDRHRNRAYVDADLKYSHFRNFSYNVGFAIPQNGTFLAFNVNEKINPVYWGTIYATGYGAIYGDSKSATIDIIAKNKSNSKFFFSLGDNMTAGDYQFITFRDKSRLNTVDESVFNDMHALHKETTIEDPFDLNIFIQMEGTPEAQITLIMDPNTGDMIRGTGAGNVRLEYNKANDLRLYGTYTIEKGSYYFNLQDVIMRDFSISEGSTIAFRGDPLGAELGIEAIYQVTANLTDLSESMFADSKELSRPTVPVQCVLNIEGDLRRPDLSFDINLPTVSQDIDRQVKSIICTDDMLNRQMIYLMVLNKFYTPDYANAGQQNRYNELASVASSTLSSQLNNLLGQISDNWNIGTNIRSDKGDFSDVEVELALSSQLLNNRLIFNGNLGYRDDQTNSNNSFIGDFDLEYLLNPAGSFRLKAYNHYNDRNYSVKSALTTQGVGIMMKKEFSTLGELWSIFKSKNKRTEDTYKTDTTTQRK